MPFATWQDFYASDAQGLYALLAVPALFLPWLLARGRRSGYADAPFVFAYCVVFTVQTLLDPIATGPLVRALGIPVAALMVPFVLLGDFRVFLIVLHLSDAARELGRSIRVAALATLFVPIAAVGSNALWGLVAPDETGQRLWLCYELFFLGVALVLRQRVVPARAASADERGRLQALCTYVAVYYALWATADVLILYAGLDAGWGLRAVPNQLYYAFWVPFVYFVHTRATSG